VSVDPTSSLYVQAVVSGPTARISRGAFTARTGELVPVPRRSDCSVVWQPFVLVGADGALALPSSITVVERDDTCDDILILFAPTCEIQIDMFANGDGERGSLPDFTPGDASLNLANSLFDCRRLPSLDPALHAPMETRYYHGYLIRGCWDDDHWISIRLQSRELDVLESTLACIDLRRAANL
jgi:hypothetical protein